MLVAAAARAYDPLTPLHRVESSEFVFKTDRHDVPARIYRPTGALGPLPVILFSHGLGGSRDTAGYLGRHWAARGYAVIFLQHPGSDSEVWQGKWAVAALLALKRAASVESYIARAADVTAVLDALENPPPHASVLRGLDPRRVGLAGHSFGAKTTQALGGEALPGGRSLADPRIRAALPMSPRSAALMSPRESFGAVLIPWLTTTGHPSGSPAPRPSNAARSFVPCRRTARPSNWSSTAGNTTCSRMPRSGPGKSRGTPPITAPSSRQARRSGMRSCAARRRRGGGWTRMSGPPSAPGTSGRQSSRRSGGCGLTERRLQSPWVHTARRWGHRRYRRLLALHDEKRQSGDCSPLCTFRYARSVPLTAAGCCRGGGTGWCSCRAGC